MRVVGHEIPGTGGDPRPALAWGEDSSWCHPALLSLSGFSISEEKSFMYTLHLILHCGKLDKSEVFVSPLHSSEMEVVKISC